MEKVVHELTSIVNDFAERLSSVPDEIFAEKPFLNKWSKKEVIGHLIDSAQNNLRRFIVGQYDTTSSIIVYDQDFWVTANGYQDMSKDEIILLWRLINERISAVLTNMPPEAYSREVNTSKHSPELRSLDWLAIDYVKHLKHHLNQVFVASFNVTYP